MLSNVVASKTCEDVPEEMADAIHEYTSDFILDMERSVHEFTTVSIAEAVKMDMERDEYQSTTISMAEAVKIGRFHTNTVSILVAKFFEACFAYRNSTEKYPMLDSAKWPPTEKKEQE